MRAYANHLIISIKNKFVIDWNNYPNKRKKLSISVISCLPLVISLLLSAQIPLSYLPFFTHNSLLYFFTAFLLTLTLPLALYFYHQAALQTEERVLVQR
jgi:hypothetical protein